MYRTSGYIGQQSAESFYAVLIYLNSEEALCTKDWFVYMSQIKRGMICI